MLHASVLLSYVTAVSLGNGGGATGTRDCNPRFRGMFEPAPSRTDADIELVGRRFRVRRQLLEDANAQNVTRALAGLNRALLVFHAPTDAIVDIENARRIYEAARHPKSFVSLAGVDHLLSRPEDAHYVATVLAAWATRYLDDPTSVPAAAPGGGSRG